MTDYQKIWHENRKALLIYWASPAMVAIATAIPDFPILFYALLCSGASILVTMCFYLIWRSVIRNDRMLPFTVLWAITPNLVWALTLTLLFCSGLSTRHEY